MREDMKVSPHENEIEIAVVRYVFVEGDSDKCKKCALYRKMCVGVPCAPMWRNDHKGGYFKYKNKHDMKKN